MPILSFNELSQFRWARVHITPMFCSLYTCNVPQFHTCPRYTLPWRHVVSRQMANLRYVNTSAQNAQIRDKSYLIIDTISCCIQPCPGSTTGLNAFKYVHSHFAWCPSRFVSFRCQTFRIFLFCCYYFGSTQTSVFLVVLSLVILLVLSSRVQGIAAYDAAVVPFTSFIVRASTRLSFVLACSCL